MHKWRSVFFLPFILGIILSAVVITLLLLFLPKYNAVIVEELNVDSNCSIYYIDLNNDGESEKINYFKHTPSPNLYLYDNQDVFMSMWLYKDSLVENSELLFCDYNNDSIKEVFSFHQNNDSLFLYCIEYSNENDFLIKRQFISSFFANNTLVFRKLVDINNDHFNDLFIVVRSDIQPFTSKVITFDIQNKKHLVTKNFNASISNVIIQDVNNDGKNEFYFTCKSNNTNGNGTQAGIIVLDKNFDNIFNPISFVGKPSEVTINPLIINGKPRLAVLHSRIISQKRINELMIFDFYGKKLNETSIACNNSLSIIQSEVAEEEILITSEKKILRVNKDLEIVKETIIGKDVYSFIAYNDIDKNKDNELLFKSKNEIVLFTDNLNQSIRIKLTNEGIPVFSKIEKKGKTNQVNLNIGAKNVILEFFNNNEYMNRNILYIILYLSITFIAYIIMNFLFKHRKKKQLTQFIENEEEQQNYIKKQEDKLGTKISGLKSKVLEIKQDDGSYKEVMDQINDTYIELKNISEKINRENSRGIYIHDFFNNLAESSTANEVKINLYPNDEWYEISTDLQNHLFKLIDDTLNHISDLIRNVKINVQLTRHLNYINCIIEIEESFIDVLSQKSEKRKAIDSRLLLINGKYDTDGTQGKGTIINFTIPLNVSLSDIKGQKKIKIIIAEDHDVSLFGLITLFKTKEDIEVIGTAKNGMEVLKILEEKTPDIVITDISMPGMDGIELSEKLKNDFSNIKVIVFTMYMENWFIEQLTKNGTRGFVSKNSRIIELVEAVRQVAQGNFYYCHQFKSKFGTNGANGHDSQKAMLDSLTSKELQIVEFFSNNLKRKEIAAKLYVHQSTIDTYIANIMLKLNAGDEDEIIRIAKRQKFVE